MKYENMFLFPPQNFTCKALSMCKVNMLNHGKSEKRPCEAFLIRDKGNDNSKKKYSRFKIQA